MIEFYSVVIIFQVSFLSVATDERNYVFQCAFEVFSSDEVVKERKLTS